MSIPRIGCLALVVGVLVCCGCGEKSAEEAVAGAAEPNSDSDPPARPARSWAELAAEAALLGVSDPEPAETEGPAPDDLSEAQKAAEAVEKVCESLLKQIQEKPSVTIRDVESFCFWCERLLQAQISASRLRAPELPAYRSNKMEVIAELIHEAFDAHTARLKRLAKVIRARGAAGEADALAVSAAESLIPLAEQQLAAYFGFRQIEQERELEIVLPDASEAQPLSGQPGELFVNVDAEGRYDVAGKVVRLEELESILKAARVNNPGRAAVVIRADRRTHHQAVAAVMNACARAGIRDCRFTRVEP